MIDNERLDLILSGYQQSFTDKIYSPENDDYDLLMQAYGITPDLKRENRQYWGRELGKCWERLIVQICSSLPDFKPAQKIGRDEPYDLIVGKYAIDAKYRLGSGDSGTHKKFRQYGQDLLDLGYTPVLLTLREDNLLAFENACRTGGWKVLAGQDTFDFLKEVSGFDLQAYLIRKESSFLVIR